MTALEKYLDDLDNLLETGWFPDDKIEEAVFYHKELTLKEFVSKGREIIRQRIITEKLEKRINKKDSALKKTKFRQRIVYVRKNQTLKDN